MMMKSDDASNATKWNRIRSNLRSGVMLFSACLLLKLTGLVILAFSSHDVVAGFIGQDIPVIICIVVIAGALLSKRWLLASSFIVAGLMAIAPLQLLGLPRELAIVYWIRIHSTPDYARRCTSQDGIHPNVLEICESYDWGWGEGTVAVVRLTGDPAPLLQHQLDHPPRGISPPAPFGIGRYEAVGITRDYYVAVFDNTLPPDAKR